MGVAGLPGKKHRQSKHRRSDATTAPLQFGSEASRRFFHLSESAVYSGLLIVRERVRKECVD